MVVEWSWRPKHRSRLALVRRRTERCEATYGTVHGEGEIQEEQTEILRTEAVTEHEDEAAHDHDRNRVHPEPISVTQSVGSWRVSRKQLVCAAMRQSCKTAALTRRMKVTIEHHEDIGRSNQEERNDIAVPEGRRQRGEEVLKPSGTGDAVIHRRDEIRLQVLAISEAHLPLALECVP